MAFHERYRGFVRSVVKCLLPVLPVIFFAATDCVMANEEKIDVNSGASEVLGQHVMISFKWAEPTSVLESLIVGGTLIRAEGEFLVVDLGTAPRTEQQERVLETLERGQKLRRDPDKRTVYVPRREIAEVRLYPRS